MPATLRANSITAHCMPRQIPKNGILFSLACRIASILPSIPRAPKPGATKIPCMPLSMVATFVLLIFSESIQVMSTFALLIAPA